VSARYLFLPSPLRRHAFFSAAGPIPKTMSRTIVDGFVGFVFTLAPYATQCVIFVRSWQLLNSWWILFWNCMCLATMVLAFTGAIIANIAARREADSIIL
jgi:hypothetical protein